MHHSAVVQLNVAWAEGRVRACEQIDQHEIMQFASELVGLKPVGFTQQIEVQSAHLLNAYNAVVAADNAAFYRACSELSINPRWVEQKHAEQLSARMLFADMSMQAMLSGAEANDPSKSIKGWFGLSVSHAIFGLSALSSLQLRAQKHEMSGLAATAMRSRQARESLAQNFIEETQKAIELAGPRWNANLRNNLRDIAFVAVERETGGSIDQFAFIDRVAETLLRKVGLSPLCVV